MKAWTCDRYGGAKGLELRELAPPEPGAGELRVRVLATSLNPLDWRFLAPDPWFLRLLERGWFRPGRPVPGVDIAGVVEAVGDEVEDFVPGQEVFGWGKGGLAERAIVSATQLVPLPDGVDPGDAASMGVAGCTALQGLRDHGQLQAGQRVLVNGASGGVGHLAVQLARELGGQVTAVCHARNAGFVQQLGAERVLDYTTVDFTAGQPGYDLVLDMVGNASLEAIAGALAPRGRCVIVGFPTQGWHGGMGRMAHALWRSWRTPQSFSPFTAEERREDMALLVGMLREGKLRVERERRWAFAEARDALLHLESGRPRGKVVVDGP